MRKSQRWQLIVTPLVICLICSVCVWRAGNITSGVLWYSILPPLIAVSLALLTRKLLLALAAGIITGGFLSFIPEAPAALNSWSNGLLASPRNIFLVVSDPINLQILMFVCCVLMMISLLIAAGGLLGIINYLARFARGPRSTQFMTVLMGLAVFIDDYANTMIVGSAMRPLTDKGRISREKLAFLVDATSAPIAGIAIISTWIGYEVGLFADISASLGFGRDGYSMFFDALSYRFYCLLMIIFILANTISGRDWGPMAAAQKRSTETGALAAPDARPMTSPNFAAASPASGALVRASTAVVPIAALFLVLLSLLWIDGGGTGLAPLQILNLRAWRDVLGNAENSILILFIASATSMLIAVVSSRLIARLPWSFVSAALRCGLRSSLLPVTILILAWSLKTTCDTLQTGQFLVAAVGNTIPPLLFPTIVFLLSGMVAFATGTSWGTMAILIPTAVPIAYQLDGGVYGLVTMITLGAVLDGAILGDHCSPISDTTIMSSISSACDHIHHVNTQIPYSLTVGCIAILCGYLPAACGLPPGIGLLIGTVVIVCIYSWLYFKPRPDPV